MIQVSQNTAQASAACDWAWLRALIMGSSRATTTPQEAMRKENMAPQPDFCRRRERGRPATDDPVDHTNCI